MAFARLSSGEIPLSGIFSVKRWAEFFDVDEATIRRWVKQYEVPFFKPGAAMFISVDDFVRRLPYSNREEE
jgi:hypothetical protein